MHVERVDPPRRFAVGKGDTQLAHCADLWLESEEMVTFRSASGGEYDVTRKEWGYYATPSLGKRVRAFGMRAALMRNRETQQRFVVLVEMDKEAAWRAYMAEEAQDLVAWLDDDAGLDHVLSGGLDR